MFRRSFERGAGLMSRPRNGAVPELEGNIQVGRVFAKFDGFCPVFFCINVRKIVNGEMVGEGCEDDSWSGEVVGKGCVDDFPSTEMVGEGCVDTSLGVVCCGM